MLTIYFVINFVALFLVSFYLGKKIGADHPKTASLSFIAASNNFELAIAVVTVVSGSIPARHSKRIGPHVEVPVLISLAKVAKYFQRDHFSVEY